MLPASSTIEELLARKQDRTFSRIPLFRDNRDHVIGYVVQRDVLDALATGASSEQALETLVRPVSFLVEQFAIANALQQFLQRAPV